MLVELKKKTERLLSKKQAANECNENQLNEMKGKHSGEERK